MTELASLGLSIRSDGVVVATDRLKDFEGAGRRAEDVTGSLARMAAKAGAVLAGAFSIRALQQYADAWSDMQSRVGAAVKDMEAAPALMQRMVDLANASYSPLEQTVEVYTRNVGVLRDLGVAASGAADFTESLNHMLVITATRGERAASVQNALSKAMATGKLQADGLETVLANGGRVAEALATELGTTVSGLRSMSSEGKITGEVIKNALLNSLEDVREEASKMPATIGDAFTRIQTNTTALIGTLDQAWGISGLAAEQLLLGMADGIRASADTYLRLGNIVASVVGPAFDMLGANMGTITSVATVAVAAMAGFYAPAMISGLWATSGALVTGVAGGIKAVTAAMLANPLGLLIAGLAATITAAYLFRDQIKQTVGIDVVAIAKGAANNFIGMFVGAYQAVVAAWDLIPAAFADIFTRAMNGAIDIVQNGVNGIIGALRNVPGLGGLEDADLSGFKREETGASNALGGVVQSAFMNGFSQDHIGSLATGLKDIWDNATGATEAIGALAGQLGEGDGGEPGAAGGLAGAAGAANDNLKAANDNIWGMTEALTALGPAAVDPLTLVGSQLTDLNNLLAQGKISWEQYGEAAYRANAGAMSSVLGLASGMTGALAQMFQDNKAFAVANAVVSTAEAVMKALATYGPTPWGFAAAGVAAATGAAQIATILSAQKGSSSASRPSGSAAPASSQAPAAQRAVQLNVTLGGSGRYSRDDIRDLLEQLTDGLNDGVDQGNFKLAVNS